MERTLRRIRGKDEGNIVIPSIKNRCVTKVENFSVKLREDLRATFLARESDIAADYMGFKGKFVYSIVSADTMVSRSSGPFINLQKFKGHPLKRASCFSSLPFPLFLSMRLHL